MQRPRLVASDVDGTLLDPLERITDHTRAVVHRVVAAGVPFVLVTGRPPRWVTPIVEMLGHAGPTVCANGAVRYDPATDAVRDVVTLDPPVLRDVARVVLAVLPGARLAVERPGATAADEEFLGEPGYTHPWPGGDSETTSRDVLLGRPAVKLLVRVAGMGSDAMAEALGAVLDGAVDVTFSTGHGLVELSSPGVTKATGLAAVAAELGVAAADVIAFGDMPNDVPMLRWAGCGVAMANAHPAALAAADEVTGPNSEDGLAMVLERWF